MNHRIFYHSEAGAAHLAAHAKKQDHGRAARLSCGGSFAAVADGHGSKLYARSSRGANLAVIAAARLLSRDAEAEAFPQAVKAAWDSLVRRDLERHPPTERELALLNKAGESPEILYGTTLLAAKLLPDGTAELFQLGDGEIHVLLADGSWAEPMPADPNCSGSATSSMAYGAELAAQTFRHCTVPNAAAVLLYTDGYRSCTSRPFDAVNAFLAADDDALFETLRAGSGRKDDLTIAILGSEATQTDAFREGFEATRKANEEEEAAARLIDEYAFLIDQAQQHSVYLHLVAARFDYLMHTDSYAELAARYERRLDEYDKVIARLAEIETILNMKEGA